jgi:MoaA/NifB/PqqE/SkfB family radical SAM enzyme
MPELLAMASKTLPRAKLLIQTNGDFLTVEKGLALFEAGLHKLIINVYDDKEQLGRLQNLVAALVKKRPGLRQIRSGLGPMIRSENRGKIKREISIDNKTWWRGDSQENWAGNIPGALAEPLKKSCIRPFNQLYVHYNGNAVLCCSDWKGEVVLGNVLEQGLSAVWLGPVATRYREKLARKDRRLKLCAVCNYCGRHSWQDRLMLAVIRFFQKA